MRADAGDNRLGIVCRRRKDLQRFGVAVDAKEHDISEGATNIDANLRDLHEPARRRPDGLRILMARTIVNFKLLNCLFIYLNLRSARAIGITSDQNLLVSGRREASASATAARSSLRPPVDKPPHRQEARSPAGGPLLSADVNCRQGSLANPASPEPTVASAATEILGRGTRSMLYGGRRCPMLGPARGRPPVDHSQGKRDIL